MSPVQGQAVSDEPSSLLVESMRASTRSLRSLFLIIFGLSFLVGFSIFQQPWWIIERLGWATETIKHFEMIHRDYVSDSRLVAMVLKKFDRLKVSAIAVRDGTKELMDRLESDNPELWSTISKRFEDEFSEEEEDYLDLLIKGRYWNDVARGLSRIHQKKADELDLGHLFLFSIYLYPEFWREFLNSTIKLMENVDKYTQGVDANHPNNGVVSATLGKDWQEEFSWREFEARGLVHSIGLGTDWDERLLRLPRLGRFVRSTAALDFFCQQYQVDPCTLSGIRAERISKIEENVLRNLEIPYLGKGFGNLQIVLAFPFVLFTLVLMLYLQMRRRAALFKELNLDRKESRLMLMDAPNIFANVELFASGEAGRSARLASIGLRVMVMLVLIYALTVVGGCLFYVGQALYFEAVVIKVGHEAVAELGRAGLAITAAFLQYPWAELVGLFIWIIGALVSVVLGAWFAGLIWQQLQRVKKSVLSEAKT
jgi:hypothetical protein